MTTQAQQFKDLFNEFISLKKELFGDHLFVIIDLESPRQKRYDQLLCFFYPQFRSKGWINPITGEAL